MTAGMTHDQRPMTKNRAGYRVFHTAWTLVIGPWSLRTRVIRATQSPPNPG